MRSLDKFYKYLENREPSGTEASAESPVSDASEPGRVAKSVSAPPAPGSRYVIRNGVTVAVPRDQVSPSQPGLVPKDDVVPLVEEPSVSEPVPDPETPPDEAAIWRSLPENVQRLALLSAELLPDAETQATERRQLIERLLNPLLSLEDTARLLGLCTATVRRYANKGALAHQRTIGQQRRFLLSDVLALMESRKPSSGENS